MITNPDTQMQDAGKPTAPSTKIPVGFTDFDGLCAVVPLSPRSLRTAIKDGRIPCVRLPGGRRLIFHLPSVEKCLLRFQKNGIPE
jgi:hypothetical protein